jgi:DNA polymerase III subunit delta
VEYASFLLAADKGQAPPVVLLHGAEPLLLDDAVARVTRSLFPDQADLSLVREVFDGRSTPVEDIVRAALTLPLLCARRLVVIKGAETIGAKAGEPLTHYVKSPNPSTLLLIVASTSLTPSHWLINLVPRTAVVSAVAPVGAQLPSWLRHRARADGFELDSDAAALLVQLSGDDLAQLRGEIEKAALAGGPDNRRVGVAEVRAVVGEHRVRHIFELTRALTRRDLGGALAVCESLLNAGEEPLGVLGMLAREVRALWQAAEGLARGRREEEVARELRRPPSASALVIERARALAPGAAARFLDRCYDTERRLKLGAAPRAELSLLIADLCAG